MYSEIENGVNEVRLRDTISNELKLFNVSLEKDIANQYFNSVVLHFM